MIARWGVNAMRTNLQVRYWKDGKGFSYLISHNGAFIGQGWSHGTKTWAQKSADRFIREYTRSMTAGNSRQQQQ